MTKPTKPVWIYPTSLGVPDTPPLIEPPANAIWVQRDKGGNIQQAINDCPVNGTVYLEPGTYPIGTTVYPKSNMTLLGAGPTSAIYAPDTLLTLVRLTSCTNTALRQFKVLSNNPAYWVNTSIGVSASSFCTLSNLVVDQSGNAIKIDGGTGPNSHLTVEDIVMPQVYQGFYVSYTTDSVFRRLTIETYRTPPDNLPHCVYLSSNIHRLVWEDLQLSGGGTYPFQWYQGVPESPAEVYSDFQVNNVTFTDTPQGFAVGSGFQNIVIDGVYGRSTRWEPPNMAWLDIHCTNQAYHYPVTMKNFDLAGGGLVGTHDTSGGVPGPVYLENGTLINCRDYLTAIPKGCSPSVHPIYLTNVTVT